MTHNEKCLRIQQKALEVLNQVDPTCEQVGRKVALLRDELEYAWKTACFNELVIVYEKANHLLNPGADHDYL